MNKEEKTKEMFFLVVDDDSMVRDILVQYLKSFGFVNIVEAKDGKAAIKIVRNASQPIDIIISDWEMPHVDGLTLLRAVRKEPCRKDTKFIMVTSQGSHERMKISKAAKSRVDAYIVKPFRAELLKQKVMTLANGGVDESSRDFEASILGLPGETTVLHVKGPKPKNGHVTVKDDVYSLKQLQKEEQAQKPHGKVYMGGDFDPERPPEEYDVTHLNILLILNLVKSYKKVHWYDKALKLCLEADDHFPDNADILYHTGHCYYLKGQYEKAEQYIRKAIEKKAYHVEAFTLLNEMQRLQKTS